MGKLFISLPACACYEAMDDQHLVFEHFCLERYVQGHAHSNTLTKAKGEQIVVVLNDSSTVAEFTKDCVAAHAQSQDCIRWLHNLKIV